MNARHLFIPENAIPENAWCDNILRGADSLIFGRK
jgi:hypothetical protein